MYNVNEQSFYSFTSRTWIRDSGASCFITNDLTSIHDGEPIHESIEAANGLTKATIKCKKDVIIKEADGSTTCCTAKHYKQAKVNLYSLTSALSKGGVLSSDIQNNIVINQDRMKIVFDR